MPGRVEKIKKVKVVNKYQDGEELTRNALRLYREGFNCAQSVFAAFSPMTGLDEKVALRTASAFGGGMGRQQEVCGVLTGSYMVIGYIYGKSFPDSEAKEHTIAMVREFSTRFAKKHGHICCSVLLGADMHSDEGKEFIEKNDLFSVRCVQYVETSCRLLLEIIHKASSENKRDAEK